MTDTMRVEPTLGPAPASADSPAVAELRAAVDAAPPDTTPADTTPRLDRAGLDQLSRIEEKTARIEEKYARSEARMQRVVDKVDSAMDRFSNVALQSDLAAVRGEVGTINRRLKKLPGFGALLLTSVVSAVLTAAVIILLFKYGGGFLTPVR
jgi:phytoene dehydrogenase-like protein